MTYAFWGWYRQNGSKNLAEYNKLKGCEIRLIQEKGLKSKEKENLCLFVRNKIKEMCTSKGKKPVAMKVRKEEVIVGKIGSFDPVVLAKRLSIDMSE